jgi:hypothetical protein
MESHSRWYNDIAKQINESGTKLDRKESGKYKVDLLLCLAERVDSFGDVCSQCQTSRQEIAELSKTLSEFSDLINARAPVPKEQRKIYFKKINSITSHLQKRHKLVMEGQYMGLWMSIGVAIGLGLGAALDRTGAGMPIGIGIGIVIGAFLDWKAKKEGRIICPKSATSSQYSGQIKLIIAGLVIFLILGLVFFFYFERSQGS